MGYPVIIKAYEYVGSQKVFKEEQKVWRIKQEQEFMKKHNGCDFERVKVPSTLSDTNLKSLEPEKPKSFYDRITETGKWKFYTWVIGILLALVLGLLKLRGKI